MYSTTPVSLFALSLSPVLSLSVSAPDSAAAGALSLGLGLFTPRPLSHFIFICTACAAHLSFYRHQTHVPYRIPYSTANPLRTVGARALNPSCGLGSHAPFFAVAPKASSTKPEYRQ